MKTVQIVLCIVLISLSSSTIAQSNGQMAFTSTSPNANKLLRSAWVDLADFKIPREKTWSYLSFQQ